MLVEFKICLLFLVYVFLLFFPSTYTVLYIIPKNSFTCSAGYNYHYCNRYISSNITVVAYEYDNNFIGQYKFQKGSYFDIINCKILLKNEKFEINKKFIGFYDTNYQCFTKKKVDEIIKKKDDEKRSSFLFGIWMFLTIFSYVSTGLLLTIPCYLKKNHQEVQPQKKE